VKLEAYLGQGLGSEIYLRIDSIDLINKTFLADFVESNNFALFNALIGTSFPVDGPSMILFTNYFKQKRAGSIYAISTALITQLSNESRITIIEDSFIIRMEINLAGIKEDIFKKSISHKALSFKNPSIYFFDLYGSGDKELISLPSVGKIEVIIKNIGQGSWNEVLIENNVRLVFDIGTHYSTKASQVISMLENKDNAYQKSNPGLIISHWDVDHYHFIKAMKDATISSFQFILCRNFVPSLMSRVIFSRLSRLNSNCIAVGPDLRTIPSLREIPLFEYYNNHRFTIFNSGVSRNKNKDGLSVLIRNSTNSILLPGDQHYSQFDYFVIPKYLNYKHIHYLIVPHHGGNAGAYKYKLSYLVKRGNAIISVGKNTYGHPFANMIKSLGSDRFQVCRTDIQNNDIVISL
jgi:beta-lactamase superfamily II metal-dependent hydrolase